MLKTLEDYMFSQKSFFQYHTINNTNPILTIKQRKKNWTKKYHKIIQELEIIADIQLQPQNIIKLANTANNQLVDIKTTLLSASKD